MKSIDNKHQFAIYWPSLSTRITNASILDIDDTDLFHRLAVVLRLAVGQSCILFDRHHHATVNVIALGKKKLSLQVLTISVNRHIAPKITFLLPLLKKESLEAALYSLVEMGIQEIQLVVTEKVQRKWIPQEYERLQKIMIAAAEQSKQFVIPELHEPVSLSAALAVLDISAQRFYADPEGSALSDCLAQIANSTHSFYLMVGPEGDLLESEKELLRNHHFSFCSLTPTVLRACQAAGLFAGIFRSYIP